MCKIFAMTNMEKVKMNSKFINLVKNQVTKTTDKHGFGYAAVNDKGELFGETACPIEGFMPMVKPFLSDPKVEKLGFVTRSSDWFGIPSRAKQKAFIAHGRFSTNTISLENTHPFVDDSLSVALVHNGVVSDNTGEMKGLLSTDCDTEILFKYWKRGGISDVAKNVGGYYAFASVDSNGLLHVARDSRATLYLTYSRTVNSYIIATTESIITGIAAAMKWRIEPIEMINDNSYVVFNRNEIVKSETFETTGYTGYISKESLKGSLGKAHWKETETTWNEIPSYKESRYYLEEEFDKVEYDESDIPFATNDSDRFINMVDRFKRASGEK